jgi:hypothetical protein
MTRVALIGQSLARFLLLPGDAACDALGIGQSDNRDLIRMLVNSVVWTLVSDIVVAIAV